MAMPYKVRDAKTGLRLVSMAQVAINKIVDTTTVMPSAFCVPRLNAGVNGWMYGPNIPSQKSALRYLIWFMKWGLLCRTVLLDCARCMYLEKPAGVQLLGEL